MRISYAFLLTHDTVHVERSDAKTDAATTAACRQHLPNTQLEAAKNDPEELLAVILVASLYPDEVWNESFISLLSGLHA